MNENQNGPGRGNEGGPNNNKNHSTLIIFLSVTLITLLVMSFFNNLMTKSTASEEIKYNEFLRLLDEDKVKSVKISSDKLTITPSSQPLSSGGVTIELYTGKPDDPDLIRRLEEADVEYWEEIPDTTTDPDLDRSGHRDAPYERRRRNDGCRKEPRKDVYAEGDRRDVQGCGRSG